MLLETPGRTGGKRDTHTRPPKGNPSLNKQSTNHFFSSPAGGGRARVVCGERTLQMNDGARAPQKTEMNETE